MFSSIIMIICWFILAPSLSYTQLAAHMVSVPCPRSWRPKSDTKSYHLYWLCIHGSFKDLTSFNSCLDGECAAMCSWENPSEDSNWSYEFKFSHSLLGLFSYNTILIFFQWFCNDDCRWCGNSNQKQLTRMTITFWMSCSILCFLILIQRQISMSIIKPKVIIFHFTNHI